ncbi:MAG: hypothetical protein MUF64_10125 [Polyangiaceae bacterium]|jgi:hypothetical protein|nr:hypothetical protein [Polyangiaceae bacterium]
MAAAIARTLEDAADRLDEVSDPASSPESTAATYVEPPGAQPDPDLPPTDPTRVEIVRKLARRKGRREKIFVTGQKGAGKTMTLHRVVQDPVIQQDYVPLFIETLRVLPQGSADVRLLLIALVSRLCRFIDEKELDKKVDFAGAKVGGITGVLASWVSGHKGNDPPGAPAVFQSTRAEIALQFLKLSGEIVRDPERRRQVLEDRRYSVTDLLRLSSALIEFVQEALTYRDGPRHLLLVLDDLDKFLVPSEVRSLFYDGLEALRSLPCSAILTYPYFLNFQDSFAHKNLEETHIIPNIKVAERSRSPDSGGPIMMPLSRRQLLPAAQNFFNALYTSLADIALVQDQGVLDRAALLSAGIPREFLRLLSQGFWLCSSQRKQKLDLPTLNLARIQIQQAMARIANEPWRQAALKLVQTHGTIQGFSQLLDTVHIVEYVNANVWYGVHPAMEDLVDSWIKQDRTLLIDRGSQPAAIQRELDALWKEAASKRPSAPVPF